jgi:hypothetical protein
MRSVFTRITFLAVVVTPLAFVCPVHAQDKGTSKACEKLLSQEEIAKATGLDVGKGEKGPKFSGTKGSCVWKGSDGTKIVVMLSDSDRMQTTMDSMAQTGGTQYDGLGTGAVGTKGIPETGGGYNLSFTDSKGGVAVSIPGSAGTSDRTLALGKLIEKRRTGASGDKAGARSAHGVTASGQGVTASPTTQGQTAQVP